MIYSMASLSDEQLAALRAQEEATGVKLLALKRLDVAMADLTEEQLASIQQLEVDLGLALVAVEA
jgi:hypothetical protein